MSAPISVKQARAIAAGLNAGADAAQAQGKAEFDLTEVAFDQFQATIDEAQAAVNEAQAAIDAAPKDERG